MDEKARKVIPFTKVDMGAQFAASVLPFRKRKVKILNGVHTMSVLAGYNAGFKIVRDMVNDETLKAYILKGLNEEILEMMLELLVGIFSNMNQNMKDICSGLVKLEESTLA